MEFFAQYRLVLPIQMEKYITKNLSLSEFYLFLGFLTVEISLSVEITVDSRAIFYKDDEKNQKTHLG